MSDFLDIKDEIIDGDPVYNIIDKDGNIINENVFIDLANTVVQDGTELNKNFFKKMEDRFDYIKTLNDEEKYEFSHFYSVYNILESDKTLFYSSGELLHTITYIEDENAFYVLTTGRTSNSTPASPINVYRVSNENGVYVQEQMVSYTTSLTDIMGITIRENCIACDFYQSSNYYTFVYDIKTKKYYRISPTTGSDVSTYTRPFITKDYIYRITNYNVISRFARENGTFIDSITCSSTGVTTAKPLVDIYIQENEYIITRSHGIGGSGADKNQSERISKFNLNGELIQSLAFIYNSIGHKYQNGNFIDYDDTYIIFAVDGQLGSAGDGQLLVFNKETFEIYASVTSYQGQYCMQRYGNKISNSTDNKWFLLPDLIAIPTPKAINLNDFTTKNASGVNGYNYSRDGIFNIPSINGDTNFYFRGISLDKPNCAIDKYVPDLFIPFVKEVK